MRGQKPYTNATWTRRVDHAGGRHRPTRAFSEPAFCPGCYAVYTKRHWSRSPSARVRARRVAEPVTVRICPACRRRQSGVPHGYLHIDGDFFPQHRSELEHLLHNEVERAREDNPLQQVVTWEDLNGDGLLISTTTDHLAQRLGHALQKAYDGDVHYGFSHENKLVRVWWHR